MPTLGLRTNSPALIMTLLNIVAALAFAAPSSAQNRSEGDNSSYWTDDEPLGTSGWSYTERYAAGSLVQCQVHGEVTAVNGTEATLTIAILSKGSWIIRVDDDEWTRRIKTDWGWNEGQRFENVQVLFGDKTEKATAQTLPNLEFAVFLSENRLQRTRRMFLSSTVTVIVGGQTFKAWQLGEFEGAIARLSRCNLARN